MNDSMRARLERLEPRLAEVNARLSGPDAARDLTEFRRLTREHAELTQLLERFEAYLHAEADLATARQMRDAPEMREFADSEAEAAGARMAAELDKLQRLLLPRDPNDERDVLLEIRAGTGGDESALFAGDLLRMYLRYAERARWQTEILSANASELGGYREVIVRIAGDAVYSRLKFESGGHRVQRVPETEAQGRIHTSACTVAVM
ncbi:MAG: PCRF domain-containing protein, partial [Betaproteobacteria bacterium]